MKWLWRSVLGLIFLLALLAGGITWLGSREESLQWLLQRAIKNTPLKLELQGLQGSLRQGVRIERVKLEHPSWRLDLRQVGMHWFYWPPDHLQIPRLRVAEVQFEQLKSSDELLTLPHSLALPFDLNISSLTIERILITSSADGVKSTQEIKHLQGHMALGKEVHELRLSQLYWAGSKMQGQLQIGATAPYATSISFQWDTDHLVLAGLQSPWKKLRCELQGDLTALKLQARWQSGDAKPGPVPDIIATTVLRPMSEPWLEPIKLQVRGLNWSSLVQDRQSPLAGWQALLDADILLSLLHGQLQVDLEIKNKLPGKWVEKKLPLVSLQARIEPAKLGWQVRQIQLMDWSGESVTGSAQWLATAGQQQARAELHWAGLRAEASWMRQQQAPGHWQAKLEAKQWNPASLNASLLKQGWRALPAGDINGSFKLTQTSSGIPFELSLQNSRWANVPITGQARGVMLAPDSASSAWQVSQIELMLNVAEARLQGAGSLGSGSSRLSLAVSAPKLERVASLWGIPAAGSAEVNAVIGGHWDDPLITGSLNATQLRWGSDKAPTLHVARVSGYVQIVDQKVDVDLNVGRIKLGDTVFNEAGLQARGGLEQHVLNMRAQGAGANRPLQASAEWAGGWFGSRQQGVWRGQWRRFDNQGQYRIRLRAPAAVEISATSFKLNNAVLEVADGQVQIEQIAYGDGQWRSRGSLERLSAQTLSRWLPGLAAPRNTLMLGGRWNLTLGDELEGEFQLSRQSGDVWLTQVSNQSLGLERLGVNVTLRNNALDGNVELFAQRAGHLQARVQTVLSERDHRFVIAGDAPLNASVKGQLTSLAWLGLLTDVPLSAEGSISLEAKASGTWKDPQLEGFLNGDQLVLRSYQPRATLREGKVRVALQSGVVYLREFSFAGRSGRLSAEGSIDPRARGDQGQIQVKLDKLDALTDPWYRLIVSGDIQMAVRDLQGTGAVRVAGKLRADQARLTLKDVTVPSLSEDVIVVNGKTEVPVAQRRFPLDVEMNFDFGDDFEVVGYGAEAQLQGNIGLQARAGNPLRAVGTVRTASGRYFAYGQELTIERGSLSFSGTLDNPGLNFYATRQNLPVEVGVEVTGTLTNPRAKLISRPEMSNTEKISWLALGRGIDSASRNDLQLLSLAASALLDRGEGLPLNQRVAKNIGLDDIGLRGGSGVEETIVSLGKRLSSRLYLTLERSLGGTSTLAKLRYEVARRWYLQALTGTESAVDLFFIFSFD